MVAVAQTAASIDTVLAGAQRSAENRARDVYRHPKETLAFFGLKPTMTVVEVSPGSGWYTEILAPYLRDSGQLILGVSGPNSAGRGALGEILTKLGAEPKIYDKVRVVDYSVGDNVLGVAPGTADMVVVFRHLHGLANRGQAEKAMKLYFAALKHGGIMGVEQHRLPEGRPDPGKLTGYLKESQVIAMAKAAGFTFAGRTDINANPKDTADYPDGVWTLPPTYTKGDVDRAKYAAIGESDRMTLKFIKP